MFSEENLFNYNSSNPAQWYNHTIIRELDYYYNGFSAQSTPPNIGDPEIELLILIILLITITSGIGLCIVILLARRRSSNDSQLKRVKTSKPSNLKHNPKINKKQ